MTLDETDRALIAALRNDARMPLSSLASTLGIARATAKARLEKLQKEGVIQGFTVRLGSNAEAPAVRAISMLSIDGHVTDKVIRKLQGLPQVRSIHSTNGRWDLVLELETPTLEAFDRLLNELHQMGSVVGMETTLLLSRRK